MLSIRAMFMPVVSTLALAAAPPALATPEAPPPFKPDRSAEDYSYLRDPARRGHRQDAYKFIPLNADGTAYLSLGGEVRERLEMFASPRFGLGGGQRDAYGLQRILAHADLRLGPSVRVFAQIGAHEAFSKEAVNPPDRDRLDVHQLFVDVRPAQGTRLRLGRQEMMFNSAQRFVSFRDGTNVRQNFEGARATYESDQTRVEAFLTRPVTLRSGVLDNVGNEDQIFGGLYASHRLSGQGSSSVDGYWFYLEREPLGERRHGVGLRYAGTRGAFDWDAEGMHQFGRDISAWAGSLDVGYTIPGSPLRPRAGLRLDAGSSDFHPLFPSGPYFNEANLTSWTNLTGVRPSLRIHPEPRLTLAAAVQFKWRPDRDAPVHLGPSAPLPGTQLNREAEIGQVYTFDAQYQLNRNLALRGYYLHHSAGDAVAAAGGRPIDYLMASATFRF